MRRPLRRRRPLRCRRPHSAWRPCRGHRGSPPRQSARRIRSLRCSQRPPAQLAVRASPRSSGHVTRSHVTRSHVTRSSRRRRRPRSQASSGAARQPPGSGSPATEAERRGELEIPGSRRPKAWRRDRSSVRRRRARGTGLSATASEQPPTLLQARPPAPPAPPAPLRRPALAAAAPPTRPLRRRLSSSNCSPGRCAPASIRMISLGVAACDHRRNWRG